MKFIKSTFLSFTIWVLIALLNALLGGNWLLFVSNELNYGPEVLLLVFIFTLLFSIPGMLIFWIVLLANWNGNLLFRSLLQTGLVISALSSLLLCILPVSMINGQQVILSGCIVLATISSIMIHHSGIKSISAYK